MKLRRISASYLFTLTEEPLKNGIVVVDNNGIIQDVIDTGGELTEIEGLEYYSGVICPGFVNAHCHLELSHLKGKIDEHLSLPGFLKQIFLLRNNDSDLQLQFMRQADRLMWMNGIVAVADISNGSVSLEVKEQSRISYYTFIECFGFLPERAPRAMEYAGFVGCLCEAGNLPFSITAHAPYSVSDQLWELIIQRALERKSTLSVHHQESLSEDQMFKDKSGELIDHYRNNLNLDTNFWQPDKETSTEAIIEKIPLEIDLLMVHNTFLDNEKLLLIQEKRSPGNTFLVTCPNANLYIENRLPDYGLLRDSGFQVCIGTDSLASNHTLSLLDEMIVISENFPAIALQELLKWSSLNGARAIRIDNWAGSITKGKRPGLNLITGIDFKSMKLTANSKVKKII